MTTETRRNKVEIRNIKWKDEKDGIKGKTNAYIKSS